MAGATPPTESTGTCGGARGLRAFTPVVRQVRWPHKFKPEMPPCYDGMADPAAFLQVYEEAIRAAGGDGKVMAN